MNINEGALSDRFTIATKGRLRINLAPQQLLNFNEKISGGSCNGGSDLKAYQFIHRYGITDDTCAPFMGLNWLRGFTVAAMTDVDDVRKHQCYLCTWQGSCTFVPRFLSTFFFLLSLISLLFIALYYNSKN
jgi:hypothetical protein